ncbi:MAG: thioesterase family protein [Pseudohongiellaceae bacterium]
MQSSVDAENPQPQDSLSDILQRLDESESHITRFSPGWTQGRSAFGGLTAAMAVAAMRKSLPSPQPLRSLMISFVAPLAAGEVRVEPRILRQGRNVTQATAELISGDATCLQAMAIFGNGRKGRHIPSLVKFNAPPRHPESSRQLGGVRLPPFLQFFEGHWTGGGVPFSGSQDRELGMWVRHRQDISRFPVEALVAVCDMPPPIILSHYDQPPVIASSLSWSLEFVVPPTSIRSDWFYLDYDLDAAAEGYSLQSGRVFTEQGELCALSRQCMVYFEPEGIL